MDMTPDEMKLAVATLLPDYLAVREGSRITLRTGEVARLDVIQWLDTFELVRDTEWLHVCHLALQKLGPMIRMRVHARMTNNMISPVTGYDPPACEVAFAPVDELLKAICQVQFPHLFEQPPVSTFHKTTT